jgi:hypothetical protein
LIIHGIGAYEDVVRDNALEAGSNTQRYPSG